MGGNCSFEDRCKLNDKIGCVGCSFQHFDQIDLANNDALKFLKEEYFNLIQEKKKCAGGRVALDEPLRKLVLKELRNDFPKIRKMESQELKSTILIDEETIDYEIKCDGAFKLDNKYIFYELKGYGDGTNDILSAITASQLLKEDSKFKNYRFYYMGLHSGTKNKQGLTRDMFFNLKRAKVTPYIRWAENKDFIKFYGIRDISNFIEDMKDFLNKV